MIAGAIRFTLTHLPLILAIAALVMAAVTRGIPDWAERTLAWLLLLAVGIESIWAGFFHVAFPGTAASFIGWQVSPFQFEIGVADLAIGAVAVASFWRGLAFKSAVVAYITLFYIGVAIGHVHQMLAAGNTRPGNFGVLLAMTLAKAVGLPLLLAVALRHSRRAPLPAATPIGGRP